MIADGELILPGHPDIDIGHLAALRTVLGHVPYHVFQTVFRCDFHKLCFVIYIHIQTGPEIFQDYFLFIGTISLKSLKNGCSR